MANEIGGNTEVNADIVTLTASVNLNKNIVIPAGVVLKTSGNTITNTKEFKVEGTLVITNTNELSGNAPYTIANGGKLMLGTTNYIANTNAIIEVSGEVNVASNLNNGYTFDIPAGTTATVAKRNSASSNIYHHGANDIINVHGTLIVDLDFANHGTINVKQNGTLTVNADKKVFAAPSNNTGKLIFTQSTLNGPGNVDGSGAPQSSEDKISGNYEWNGTKWNYEM